MAHHTLVLQVTERCVVRHLLGSTRDIEVVLLAEAGAESLIHPIVWSEGEELPVVVHAVSERGVGVDASVGTDEVLALRHIINHVAQTTILAIHADGVVGRYVCVVSRHALIAHVIVVQGLVIELVVLCGIGDAVVIDRGAAVGAPLGVERDGSLLGGALLGGDHDHTIGTTGTVQGVRGSVLEHGDAFHIVRVEIVPATVVGSTVDDDERLRVGVD